jgi:alanyl-tRNA synthetase
MKKSMPSPDLMAQMNQELAELMKKSMPSPDLMAQMNQELAELMKFMPSPDLMAQMSQELAELVRKSMPPPALMAQMNQELAELMRKSLPSPDLMVQMNQELAELVRKSMPPPDLMAQMNQELAELVRKSMPPPDLMAQMNNDLAELVRKSMPPPDLMVQMNQDLADALSKSLPPAEQLAEMRQRIFEGFKGYASLYDTFGTPRDLIRVSLEERGVAIEEEEFNKEFDVALQEVQRASAPRRVEDKAKTNPLYTSVAAGGDQSEFKGYETTRLDDSKVVALIRNGKVESLNEGEAGEVVLDRTPFYAESGGQVGDTGTLAGRTHVTVIDTFSPVGGLIVHRVEVDHGTLKVGDVVVAEVDVEKRDATRRNHTATHLMHAALREVLGTHVKQAGSVVAPNYLRFDFSHYQPLTDAEIEEIERLVNYHILRNEPVRTDEMAVEDAMRSGAMALFGEKYGEKVRVLSIKGAEGIFSKELCGGTHVRATGDIGVFKITSDESIASGVRRIRAVTGVDAYERFREDEEIISQVTSNLRTSRAELPAMIGKLQDELKKARREAEELKLKIATGAVGSAASNGDDAREVAGVRVLAREASGLDSAGMRQLSDTLLARIKSGVVVIGRSSDGKASLIVRTSDDLTKKVPAGLVIKELAPIIGGRGGGKADMAEGGGNQPEKLAEALEASYGVIERMLIA